jgi:hypothetical protein
MCLVLAWERHASIENAASVGKGEDGGSHPDCYQRTAGILSLRPLAKNLTTLPFTISLYKTRVFQRIFPSCSKTMSKNLTPIPISSTS